METFKVKYNEEAMDLIESIEKSLLLMENNVDEPYLIEEVFRDMHTLKGNSSMFGFKVIADFTHHLESIYDLVRSGEMKMSKQILNVTFLALDHLSSLVKIKNPATGEEKTAHNELSARVIKIIDSYHYNTKIGDTAVPYGEPLDPAPGNGLIDYHINFKPDKSFFLNGSNPLNIINELHQLGECIVTANVDDVPALEACDADSSYIFWDINLKTTAGLPVIEEVFAYVKHICKLEITWLQNHGLVSGFVPVLDSSPATDNLKEKTGNINTTIDHENEKSAAKVKKYVLSGIRVPTERLDNLLSLISELMTLQAKLGTLTEQNPQSELQSVTENLEKISARLRDNAFNMCLVPIKNMVTPFHRLIRDLAEELNKEIEFITEGTETELDKNIIQGLSDIILHLLRNSIDHGIEDPDQRVKSGKPRQGKILFKAYCAGTNVYIEIHDDGKGMDPDKIRRKAVLNGIITGDNTLNDKEVLNLIFLPGFSTAEKVSGISGRGVGMDVVKRKIADIRGQIRIHSQINTGTSITIKLPITVSIIDGLLVKINGANYIIPLSAVDRCHEAPAGWKLNRFDNIVILDGEQIPFISLSHEFDGIESQMPSQEIVIVYYDEKKVGLIVDRVVGKFQAVLKPLGRYFQHMENISGATILGDGKIALVLDTNYVTEQFLSKKNV